jgi:hypothetical protein
LAGSLRYLVFNNTRRSPFSHILLPEGIILEITDFRPQTSCPLSKAERCLLYAHLPTLSTNIYWEYFAISDCVRVMRVFPPEMLQNLPHYA